MSDVTKIGLTPMELACLTARVPASGTASIDALITQGLRFQAAQEFMQAMVMAGWPGGKDELAKKSIEHADALVKAFQR